MMIEKIPKIISCNSKYNQAIKLEDIREETAVKVGNLMGIEITREELIHRTNLEQHILWYSQRIRDLTIEGKKLEKEIFSNDD